MLTESQYDGHAENSIPPKTTFCGGIKKISKGMLTESGLRVHDMLV